MFEEDRSDVVCSVCEKKIPFFADKFFNSQLEGWFCSEACLAAGSKEFSKKLKEEFVAADKQILSQFVVHKRGTGEVLDNSPVTGEPLANGPDTEHK